MWLIINKNIIKLKSIVLFDKNLKKKNIINIKKIKWNPIYPNIILSETSLYTFLNRFNNYIIINQISKNLKINLITFQNLKITNVFKSTGTFLMTIDLVEKYLRRHLKGTRLFLNIYLKVSLKKNWNSTTIFRIKGFQKRSWVYESLIAFKSKTTVIFITPTNKVNTNLQTKKSIKKRIKKKIVIKENYIV